MLTEMAIQGDCTCPICSGRIAVAEPESQADAPQFYLNADARDVIAANGKESLTIAEAANRLVRGEPGWSSALGRSSTVSYAYRSTEPSTYPDDAAGFSRFNAAQIVQAELAFKAWSDVANITFVRMGTGSEGEAAYSNSASILLANYSSGVGGASAFAMFPGSTSFSSAAGDVWINGAIGYNVNPAVGNYGAMVLVHEIGHAIGLAHPADYDAEEDVSVTYANDATYYEDSRQYTVMSYFSEANTGGAYGGRYAAAPQLDDIAAAQLEYGANMSTRLGDDVYGFNATVVDRPWFVATSNSSRLIFAVWDAGGNDTLDFSGYGANQLIDLRAGNFSNVGGLTGNVAVAQGADIENARGGGGSDVIHGNGLNNSLVGGAGADTISGGAGGDTIEGAAGRSYLRGDDGADSLVGGADFDDINGNVGNDVILGGLGDDWVVGGKDDDRIFGEAGSDLVYGNLGSDTLEAGAGADIVRGGQGHDLLRGGDGDDYVSGDRGDDTVSGGAGADAFHGFSGAGIDRVTDFDRAEGDYVLLDPGTTFTVVQQGADIAVITSEGDQMILVGVDAASLSDGWIVVG